MTRIISLLFFCSFSVCAQEFFLQKPYLQLGDAPKLSKEESLWVVWHSKDADADWVVEYRSSEAWQKANVSMLRRVAVPNVEPHRVYGAHLKGLVPGTQYQYRVSVGGKQVFESTALSR